MSSPPIVLIATLALAALAGCSDADSTPPPSRAPAAKILGEGVSCLALRQITRTKVYDDRTIDFFVGGRKVYRQTDRKSTRLNSSHIQKSRMPSSA